MTNRIPALLAHLEENPQDSFALFALAKEHQKTGEHDLALEYFLQLRQLDPAYVGLYYHLGKLYETLGQNDAAFEAYEAGMGIARQQMDSHTLSELQQAFWEAGGDD